MFNRKTRIALLAAVFVLVLSFGAFAEQRMATWVDEVIIVEEPTVTTAVSRLQAGDIDVYATTSSEPVPFQTILNDPNLDYYQTFGSYSELTFNPVGPEFNDGRFNPFGVRRVREAMNLLIDRDYIAQELYGGLALPKYNMLNNAYVDYSRVVETARALEFKTHDFETAKHIISEEMMNAGANSKMAYGLTMASLWKSSSWPAAKTSAAWSVTMLPNSWRRSVLSLQWTTVPALKLLQFG